MKKIQQSWERKYKSLKLFKEDLEEILNIVTTEFGQSDTGNDWFTEVHMEVGQFELDSADELFQISEDVVESLHISVGPRRIWLSLSEIAILGIKDREDTHVMGVANRIDEILRKRQRLFGFLWTPGGFGLLLFGPLLLWFGLVFLLPKTSGAIDISALAIFAIWIGGQWYYYYRCKHFVTIYMFSSYDKPSFFKRNKDTILINLITAVIAFLLGILGTLFVQWIINNP